MNRKTIVLVLLVLIFVLGGLSVFFALQIRDPGPDTGVATPPPTTYRKVVDFEDEIIPKMTNKAEGEGIGANYKEVPGTNGIVFDNGGGCTYDNPRLIKVGSPKRAFVGPAGSTPTTDDMPANDAKDIVKQWMLSDDGALPDNEGACRIRITFEHPVKSFKFDVIDMDNGESMKVRFKDKDGLDLKFVGGDATTIQKAPPGSRAYDGRPWRDASGQNPFFYVAPGIADLREVVIIPVGGQDDDGGQVGLGYGLAYDNFEINYAQDVPQTITCYRCTAALTDANACESQQVTGTSCPAGWTTNSQCNVGQPPSNMCPVTPPPAEDGEMVVTKTGSETCGSNEESVITYSIVARNPGTTPVVIDYVEDVYDADLLAAGIIPTQITPAYGVHTSGRIRWTGTVADRTFAAGQSKTYSYRMVIPKEQIPNFTSVNNVVTVSYDGETVTDEVDVPVDCEEDEPPVDTPVTEKPELPATGILDDGSAYIVFAFMLFVAGIFVYKYRVGASLLETIGINLYTKSPFTRYEDKVDAEFKKEK